MNTPEPKTNRKCGPCSACCVILGVPEIDKSSHCECPNRQRGWKACAIYDDRPQSCRDFACMWLEGHFANRDRPDEIGCIFQASNLPGVGPALVSHEVHENASRRGRAKAIIERVARGMPVIVIPHDNGKPRVVASSPSIVRAVQANLDAKVTL